MGPPADRLPSDINDGWSKEQRKFCIEQYYLNHGVIAAVKHLFFFKFEVLKVGKHKHLPYKCPSAAKINQWVKIYEQDRAATLRWKEMQEEQKTILLESSLRSDVMDRSQPTGPYWTDEQREFCIQQYYAHLGKIQPVRRLYCEKFRVVNSDMPVCPSPAKIKQWVATHEQDHRHQRVMETEKFESSKLAGTQWGRKTGENRIVRTESIDGLQHQALKWKQRDIKWNGPRPVNEKQKVVEKPVVEEPHYYYYSYQEPIEEEVKPDRKQVIQEKFQDDILELIESLDAQGHAARASAFVSLRAALQRRAADGVLRAHRAALAEHVARALRRGRDHERKAAAAIVPLLALQIGEEGMEQFVREVRPALAATATDKSASLDTRTECCSSLAVLSYLMDDDLFEILETMRMYETIFSGNYLKDDGSVRVSGEAVEEGAWHAAALDGWALLLPLLPRDHALSLLHNQEPSFARLGEMLEASSLEVRMAAGGALAIAYETVTDDDNSDSELTEQVDELLPLLTELARDSHKFRAKKDRRIQRATFRDILKYFEEGELPSTSVHMGSYVVRVCGWRQCAAHAALASALGGALQVLAPHTERLTAALSMTDQLTDESEKPNKLQRHLQNKATSKARDVMRSRNRDKRSEVLAR